MNECVYERVCVVQPSLCEHSTALLLFGLLCGGSCCLQYRQLQSSSVSLTVLP